jgi:hypothetical protein
MYKNINIISYKNKEDKIHSLIDNLEFLISINACDLIDTISFINSRLKIIYKYETSPFIKENIELLWMELNKPSVIHIIKTEEDCKCCNSKPQQGEDQEIKDYLKYLNITNINE